MAGMHETTTVPSSMAQAQGGPKMIGTAKEPTSGGPMPTKAADKKEKDANDGKDAKDGNAVVEGVAFRLPGLREHNFMTLQSMAVPYMHPDAVMTRDQAPRRWLPPTMRIVPAVDKKPVKAPSRPVKLKMAEALDIKADAAKCAKKKPENEKISLGLGNPMLTGSMGALPMPIDVAGPVGLTSLALAPSPMLGSNLFSVPPSPLLPTAALRGLGSGLTGESDATTLAGFTPSFSSFVGSMDVETASSANVLPSCSGAPSQTPGLLPTSTPLVGALGQIEQPESSGILLPPPPALPTGSLPQTPAQNSLAGLTPLINASMTPHHHHQQQQQPPPPTPLQMPLGSNTFFT